MNLKSLNTTYNKINELWKVQSPAQKQARLDSFAVRFAYNSGKIENSSITLYDTTEVFDHGRVISYTGDLRTLYEIGNLKAAWHQALEFSKDTTALSCKDILALHQTLTAGTYDERRWAQGERPGTFKKGDYVVANSIGFEPSKVANAIKELLEEVFSTLPTTNNPKNILTISAYAHAKFVEIHPFADGNGRSARLLQTIILLQKQMPPLSIFEEDRLSYFGALDAFHEEGDLEPFITFCKTETIKTWESLLA